MKGDPKIFDMDNKIIHNLESKNTPKFLLDELGSEDKKITQYWKEKVIGILETIYGRDGVKLDNLNGYLDHLISNCNKPIGSYRDIYRNQEFSVPLDDTLQMIASNSLMIGANGTYTYRHEIKISELAQVLIDFLKNRSVVKKQAIIDEAAGRFDDARRGNNEQVNIKQFINSSYGAATMPGFVLYSPDCASMITGQGREYISELLTLIEKYLESNLMLSNINELFTLIDSVVKLPVSTTVMEKLKSPTKSDLYQRLLEYIRCLPDEDQVNIMNYKASLFAMISNINNDEAMAYNFYYRMNFKGTITKNECIKKMFRTIMNSNCYIGHTEIDELAKDKSVAAVYPILIEMRELMNSIVYAPISTYDRVEKYKTRMRDVVITSDTDSCIFTFMHIMEMLKDKCNLQIDPSNFEKNITLVNVLSLLVVDICNKQSQKMAMNCYVTPSYRDRLDGKNEFLFKSFLLYPDAKKNYSTWTVIKEGKRIDKISNTGQSLTGSNSNQFIMKRINHIIEYGIHKSEDVSIMNTMKDIINLEIEIKKRLRAGDVTFGKFSAYKNSTSAQEPWTNGVIRGVEAWNLLYPNQKILINSKVYQFKTKLETIDDLDMISDESIRNTIKLKIFENHPIEKFSKYGLRTMCVPDDYPKIPDWMLEIIDVNSMTEKHMTPVTNIIPSIGSKINRIRSNRSHMSTMVDFKESKKHKKRVSVMFDY